MSSKDQLFLLACFYLVVVALVIGPEVKRIFTQGDPDGD
jgi:hypothetical protein